MELDESTMSRVADKTGLVSKADFVKLGQDMKLLEFGGAMGEKRKQSTPRNERRRNGGEEQGGGKVRDQKVWTEQCQALISLPVGTSWV